MDEKKRLSEEAEELSELIESEWGGFEEDYSSKREAIEIAQLQEELDSKKQDRVQRKEYANKIFNLLRIYLLSVFLILCCNGLEWFSLKDTVLVAIVTTTTANVIGIFYFVAKYLFHTRE